MNELLTQLLKTIKHLDALDSVFSDGSSYSPSESKDREFYRSSKSKLESSLDRLKMGTFLYGKKDRQMILSDLIEYIFLGRGYYSIRNAESRGYFIRAILYTVNILMSFETVTVSEGLRNKLLDRLTSSLVEISKEPEYSSLRRFSGEVGLPGSQSKSQKGLDSYFDTILPKTAGGLWHELLVFIFLLRSDVGHIIPLLLTQRFIGLSENIVPPDFLIIGHDKRIYGVEVGMKKEVQSGEFALRTGIPTATIDTINSRNSDRCPICKRWIQFCDHVIQAYSSIDGGSVPPTEFRCLSGKCSLYSLEDIAEGKCPYTKYSRPYRDSIASSHHQFADTRHYHYQCVIDSVDLSIRDQLVSNPDKIALKTHFPHYGGLDALIKASTHHNEGSASPIQNMESDEE